MSYKEISGNLFSSSAQALVNTVNCVGAMGKGIALEFRRRYYDMYLAYKQDCSDHKLIPGRIYSYKVGDRLILNFAIKNHWKYPSKIEWIESCLRQFVSGYSKKGINSVAFPWMGAMNGGIPLEDIKRITRAYLKDLKDIDIEVYSFDPVGFDPLFEVLKQVANSENPFLLQESSGLQNKIFNKIMSSVLNGKVRGFADFSKQEIIGSGSLDKLYKFLVNYSELSAKNVENKKEEKAIQLSLLDE